MVLVVYFNGEKIFWAVWQTTESVPYKMNGTQY